MKSMFLSPTLFSAALLVSACGSPKPAASAIDVAPSLNPKSAGSGDDEVQNSDRDAAAQDAAAPVTLSESDNEKTEAGTQETNQTERQRQHQRTKTVAEDSSLDSYVLPQGPNETFRLVNANLAEIKACYVRELAEKTELKGTLEIEFTVNMKGRIAKTRIIENELNGSVANCVVKELKSLKYPKPKYAPETFRFPFDFSPTN